MRARRAIGNPRTCWNLRTCTAIAAGTVATMLAAAVGLLTLEHLIGVDFDTIVDVLGRR
jgi:hypothetical protein